MHVYFDSSALVKRSLDEPESSALTTQLDKFVNDEDALFTSDLAVVEVTRALRLRLDAEDPRFVAELVETSLAGIQESPISDPVINIARRLGPNTLRSLDAIHLATATLVGADLVCAYDGRLLTAASELGFRTISPGARYREPLDQGQATGG